MANRNDYPFFRFTFKGCPVDFAFSVYRSIMSVLLRFTPTESLEFPFSHDLAVDLTLLRMHEFPLRASHAHQPQGGPHAHHLHALRWPPTPPTRWPRRLAAVKKGPQAVL